MNISFAHDGVRDPERIARILRSESFLRAYADDTYAVRAEARTWRDDEHLYIELTRTNRTDDVPGFIRAIIGDEVQVTELTRWPREVSPTQPLEESVQLDVGGRTGNLTARAVLGAGATGGFRYQADGDFVLNGVPGLVRGKVTSLAADVVKTALRKKLELADRWDDASG